jgi:hypothetical protein
VERIPFLASGDVKEHEVPFDFAQDDKALKFGSQVSVQKAHAYLGTRHKIPSQRKPRWVGHPAFGWGTLRPF